MPSPSNPVNVSAVTDALARVERAHETIAAHEAELATARDELSEAVREAHALGVSYALIGRVLGVSGQRAWSLAKRAGG